MILHTNLYHFILKYNIYIFIYKLLNFLKFGWLLLKPFSYAVYWGLSLLNVLKRSSKALHWIKHLGRLKYQKQFWVIIWVPYSGMSPIFSVKSGLPG